MHDSRQAMAITILHTHFMHFFRINVKYIQKLLPCCIEVRRYSPIKETCRFFRKTFILCKLRSTIFKITSSYINCHNQNHVRNKMQFRKRLCNKGLQSYGRFCAQVQSKSRKRIEIFTFQAFVKKANHLARFND